MDDHFPASLTISLNPVAKPRMTQSDRWKKRGCVIRYFAFSASLREEARRQKFVPANQLVIQFEFRMPKSWSKKKKAEMSGKPMQSKPDIDNLQKSILDSLFPNDDSAIWKVCASKRWAETGRIIIKNWEQDKLRIS